MDGIKRYGDKMALKMCVEQIGDRVYPNLAKKGSDPYTTEWNQFSIESPYSEPVMFIEYLLQHGEDIEFVTITAADKKTFYPIALSFFDFDIDWFKIMPSNLVSKIKEKNIKILFYYSEGDNPYRINAHLESLCIKHNIPREQIKFISANSEAINIDNFYHVVDDELLYHYRNHRHAPAFYTEEYRSKKYTALVRMHKFWRANTMATLWQQRLDTDGYFAYGDAIDSGEKESDNPIEVDKYMGLRRLTNIFLSTIPFKADDLTSDDHNDHTLQVRKHFEDSYINIVLESHMDVDQTEGAFLTEKTFKPIKNSQLFIIFGPAGSLQLLRDMGYKTFDHIFNNKYDIIKNTTQRWKAVMDMTGTVLDRSKAEIHDMYIACQEDIIHNQDLFNGSKAMRLNNIIKEISK
jgi:hypothetical protein